MNLPLDSCRCRLISTNRAQGTRFYLRFGYGRTRGLIFVLDDSFPCLCEGINGTALRLSHCATCRVQPENTSQNLIRISPRTP